MEDAQHAHANLSRTAGVTRREPIGPRHGSRTRASIACPVQGLGYHTGLFVCSVCRTLGFIGDTVFHHIVTFRGCLTKRAHSAERGARSRERTVADASH